MQLAEAGTLSDDTARLWWSLFFFLIDRDHEREYVEVARSLLATCEAERTREVTSVSSAPPPGPPSI